MGTMTKRNPMAIRLAVLAVVAVAAVLVAVVLAGGPGSDKPVKTTGDTSALKGIPQSGLVLGSPRAPVTMVEFADLQCPFCAEFHHNVLPSLLDRYVRTGKVRIELRLLRFLGPDSDKLARVALAASTQNRMWQFTGLAYDRQGQENSGYATNAFINKLVGDAGVKSKVDAGAAAERQVQGNEQLAKTAGIDSTPSFLIGKTGGTLHPMQVSELTPSAFIPKIDSELGK
jgi:protein-disulfide isomerase